METGEVERSLRGDGWRVICGVDEAGRGPLVGPVYAAAVILPRDIAIDGLDDSKKLPPRTRERLFGEITRVAAAYSVASASVDEIASLNILGATYLAMSRAIFGLSVLPELAIIDGNRAGGVNFPHVCVVGGDGKETCIAAASILAKVSRDAYMERLDAAYPQYGFARHKGYGTKQHCAALREYGPTPEHRKLFLRKLSLELN
ncbi:MAG: ribonuclease HII [Oscillospiraceae bacterium]|jgi:ribonuclease HII|nr:ribonuclease HII [Oscillospiraceae bacterium]